jgi:hypothetical protein
MGLPTFTPHGEPLRHDARLRLEPATVRGAFAALKPTRAHYDAWRVAGPPQDTTPASDELDGHGHGHGHGDGDRAAPGNGTVNTTTDSADDHSSGREGASSATTTTMPAAAANDPPVRFRWTSRNNRKGRHALRVRPARATAARVETPPSTARAGIVGSGLVRMATEFPVWDVSYLVATSFTLGSVIWVINAFFVFLPLVAPATEFAREGLVGGGVTAFVGATVFEVGSYLLLLEAFNANHEGCFGWAIEQVLEGDDRPDTDRGTKPVYQIRPAIPDECSHHHANKSSIGPGSMMPSHKGTEESGNGIKQNDWKTGHPAPYRWIWWPTFSQLRASYLHDLGFLASATQFVAATIFWIAGFTSLPGIFDHLSHDSLDGAYWTPQIIGGTGFIVSGLLFTIETQEAWWKPAPRTLGWHIGMWNLIGGVGFTLCPAFGYDERSWAQYQACLSTFWGSWAFLIGSTIQWYESLEKHPVEVENE